MPSEIGRTLGLNDRIFPSGDATELTYPPAAAIVVTQSMQTISAIGEVIPGDESGFEVTFQGGEAVIFQEGDAAAFQAA